MLFSGFDLCLFSTEGITNMPKLVMVNPHPPGRHGEESISVIVQMPLNLAYVAALTPPHWEKRLIDETLELAIDEDGELTFDDADLVAITAITYQAPRAYKIAAAARRKGMKVVLGGIHASVIPDEVRHHADAVCTQESELIWPQVCADFERGELQPFYHGGQLKLDVLHDIRPDREFMRQQYDYKYSSIITTRGCPWRCEFCSVPTFQSKFRGRPVEDVLAEMESTSYRGLMFAEDNFYGYGPQANEHAKQIFRGMVERGIWKDWFGFSTLTTGQDQEALADMAKSGCFGFLVGLESDDEEVLRLMKKTVNLRIGGKENIQTAIHNIHEAGLIVWGSVIFGADGQGPDTFERMVEYILSNSIDVLTFGISCPFPNTTMHDRLAKAGRIFRTNYPDDWVYHDTANLTYTLDKVTLAQFIGGMEYVYKHIYAGDALRIRFRNTLKTNNNPRTAMFALRVGQDWKQVFEQVIQHLHDLYDSGEYYRFPSSRAVQIAVPGIPA